MDCDITAAKIIHFIQPILLSSKCTSAPQRHCIWQLLKSTVDRSDQTLIAQFERHPTLHYLRIAVTDLLTFHLKNDRLLQVELNHFLNTYYDLEALEQKAESTSDLFRRARSISFSTVVQPLKQVRKILPI